MKGFLILLKRELKAITKEKTIMFAVMIQFVIASLSSILLVGIMAFYDPSSISENANAKIRVGVVEAVSTPMPSFLVTKGIRTQAYPTMTAAESAFKQGRIDSIMYIPQASAGVTNIKLVLPELDTQQTVVMMLLQEPLKQYENYLRQTNGIVLNYNDIKGKSSNTFEFLYSIIIPVLMLFPALIAGSIIIDTISEEFENKTFETLLAAPLSLRQIFSAKLAAAVITAVVQVVLWTLLLRANGMIVMNPLVVIFIALSASAAIAFVAAFVALYFKDRERAQFGYSILLVIMVAACSFIGLSPLNLITRTASGAQSAGWPVLAAYFLLIAALGFIFFKFSPKLVFNKR
jgi:ABC-2 type transport system permease protein